MVHWKSQLWLVPLVGTIFVISTGVAIIQRTRVGNPLSWGLAFVLLVSLVQTMPLPHFVWNAISPAAGFELKVDRLAREIAGEQLDESALADATPADANATAHTISIHPQQTRASAVTFAVGLAMLLSATILFRDRLSITILLGVIAIGGFMNAVLGIYQAVVAGDWTLLEFDKTTIFATFYSRNSAPQFLSCALAAACGWMVIYRKSNRAAESARKYRLSYPSVNLIARMRRRMDEFVSEVDLISVLCLVVMVTLFISVFVANSRGGILSCVVAGCVAVLVSAYGQKISTGGVIALLMLVVGCGLFLSMFELDGAIGVRLGSVSEEAYRWHNVRFTLWQMAMSQPSSWLLGSGLGTFHFAILPAYAAPHATWYYHAENIYIELLSNVGFVTSLVAIAGFAWLVRQLLGNPSKSTVGKAMRLTCLFAVLAVGLHNLVDFSLMVPAVFLPLATIVGAFLGSREISERKQGKRRGRRSRTRNSPSRSDRTSSLRERESQSSSSSRSPDQHEPRFGSRRQKSLIQLSVLFALIAAAILHGLHPLRTFVESQRISLFLDAEMPSPVVPEIDYSRMSGSSEVRLQAGRLRQEWASYTVEHATNWPEDITDAMRASLSRPEFFSAAFAQTTDRELIQLHQLITRQTAALDALSASRSDMEIALNGCPLDWRASWGLLRADLGSLTREERLDNYARILITCRLNPNVLQAAGTHALMVGEPVAGQRIWRELLSYSSVARIKVLALLDRFLTVDQLLEMLPEQGLMRIAISRRLQSTGKADAAIKVLDTVQLSEVFLEAERTADWQAIAWAAEMKQDIDQQIAALHQAALDSPMSHRINYDLAQTLREAGRYQEAIREIDRAISHKPENQLYKTLLDELNVLEAKSGRDGR